MYMYTLGLHLLLQKEKHNKTTTTNKYVRLGDLSFRRAVTSSFTQFPGRAWTVRIEWPGYKPSSPFHQNGGEFEAKFV